MENVRDADWLCTFHIGGKTAYVYSQADVPMKPGLSWLRANRVWLPP